MKKPKLIYIYPSRSSFINSDLRFLNEFYEVKTQDLEWANPTKLIRNWLQQLIFLFKNISTTNAVVVSFAGYFSLFPVFLARLFRKKSFIILNGTDCVAFPEYNYGSLRKKVLRLFIKHSLSFANTLLPVDVSLIEQEHTFDKTIVKKKQGFKTFFPKILTPVSILPNGFDTNFWMSNNDVKQRKGFVTVVSNPNKSTAIFKGIDLIIEVAKQFPNQTFTIVGLSEKLQSQFNITENIIFYPFVTKNELVTIYNKHLFYVQLSINEGFGCALAEAMLCGCIPIISNSGALPNVTGSVAYKLFKRDVNLLKDVIKDVLSVAETDLEAQSILSRTQITENFDIKFRKNKLLKIISY